MATSSTTWKRGVSANPRGRPKAPNGRRAIRAALAAPASPGSSETVCDAWARELIAGATTTADRLAVFAFIEGRRDRPPEPRAEL